VMCREASANPFHLFKFNPTMPFLYRRSDARTIMVPGRSMLVRLWERNGVALAPCTSLTGISFGQSGRLSAAVPRPRLKHVARRGWISRSVCSL